MTPEQETAIKARVLAGPDPEKDGLVRWRYACAYIFGAICPAKGTGAALVLPFDNSKEMNKHLREISRRVTIGSQENIWQYLRQNHLANLIFDTYSDIVDTCCSAWKARIALPENISSIEDRPWLETVLP